MLINHANDCVDSKSGPSSTVKEPFTICLKGRQVVNKSYKPEVLVY